MSEPRLPKISDWEQIAREAAFRPAVMAALCPISLRQMERFFVERFDKTPREWAREARFHLARQLIAEGWSSKAVATELGFVDSSHFCREFRRFFGVAPQSFSPLFLAAPRLGSAPAPSGAQFTPRRCSPTAARPWQAPMARADVAFIP